MRNEKKVLDHLQEAVGAGLWGKFQPSNKGVRGKDLGDVAKAIGGSEPMFINTHFLKDAAKDAGLLQMLLTLKHALVLPGYTGNSPASGVGIETKGAEQVIHFIPVRLFSKKRKSHGPVDFDYSVDFQFNVDVWGAFDGWVYLKHRKDPDKRGNLYSPVEVASKRVLLGQFGAASGAILKRQFVKAVKDLQKLALGYATKALLKQIRTNPHRR